MKKIASVMFLSLALCGVGAQVAGATTTDRWSCKGRVYYIAGSYSPVSSNSITGPPAPLATIVADWKKALHKEIGGIKRITATCEKR